MFLMPMEYFQPLASSSSKTFVFQNPESARSSFSGSSSIGVGSVRFG
jgi:hypothetical protein